MKTIILVSLILGNSAFSGCFNSDNAAGQLNIDKIANSVIQNLIETKHDVDQKIDSIYFMCKGPVLIIDSSTTKVKSYDCLNLSFTNSTIRTLGAHFDYSQRIGIENLNNYYFVEIDSISIGSSYVVVKAKFGSLGTRYVYVFTYYRNSYALKSKELVEMIQF